MSDDHQYLEMTRRGRLIADVTFLMLKGAGYAALFVFLVWLSIAVIAAIGNALPDRSRETPDPINRSEIVLPVETQVTELT